jgi:hypothetical protein
LWRFLANGPVDSPPTIYEGLCVFGCGDGSVYCLDVETGKLAWRFKTSETERRIGSELETPVAPLLGTGGHQDPRTGTFCELDGGGADPAAATMDEGGRT